MKPLDKDLKSYFKPTEYSPAASSSGICLYVFPKKEFKTYKHGNPYNPTNKTDLSDILLIPC